jgi:prepilin-type N-terminal cleavage/methylation domain-containing protein
LNSAKAKRGFTLVEVVTAVALLGIGIVVSLACLSGMTKTEIRLKQSELMNRLAVQKLDEILAVGSIDTVPNSGDFTDVGVEGFEWNLEVAPSDLENLQTVRITVSESSNPSVPGAAVHSLLFTPPETTTTGALN